MEDPEVVEAHEQRDWLSIVLQGVTLLSVAVFWMLSVFMSLHPTHGVIFAFCLATVGMLVVSVVVAYTALMRRWPLVSRICYVLLAVIMVIAVIDLFIVLIFGHQVIWWRLPGLP